MKVTGPISLLLIGALAAPLPTLAAGDLPLTARQAHEARKAQARERQSARWRELAAERQQRRAELEAERSARRKLFQEDTEAWRRAHRARRAAIQMQIEQNRRRLRGERSGSGEAAKAPPQQGLELQRAVEKREELASTDGER